MITIEKVSYLINKMKKFSSFNQCILEANRIELKFERSFTMAITKNRPFQLLEVFPKNTIKTVYVSLCQLMNFKHYKQKKRNGEI